MKMSATQESKVENALGGEGGFTLAELLVFVGVMIIMLIGIGTMIRSGAQSSNISHAMSRIEDTATEALETMTRQIRVSTSINPNSTSSRLIISGDFQGLGSTSTMVFDAVGGYLRKGFSTDAMSQWVEGVSSVTFEYYDYDFSGGTWIKLTPGAQNWNNMVKRVDVMLQFSKPAGGINLERSFKGSVMLRNST